MPGQKRKRNADSTPTASITATTPEATSTPTDHNAENRPHSDDTRPTGAPHRPYKHKALAKKHAVGPLKKRRRDLHRQLSRPDDRMPANVRVQLERQLATCEEDLVREQGELQKQQMASKYHMVRFFDRKRAMRNIKQLTKLIDGTEAESRRRTELKRTLELANVDLNYALHFPLAVPYISLFPKSIRMEDESVEECVRRGKGDRAVWEDVRVAMEEGTLVGLRDRLYTKEREPILEGGWEDQGSTSRKAARSRTASKESRIKSAEKEVGGRDGDEDEDGSDGEGFFARPKN